MKAIRKAIRGGTIVTANEMYPADLLVDGERIRQIGEVPDSEADEVIDASGCLVLPGLIDNHTHLSLPTMGTVTCDDFETGTAAAAAGGTTCVIDFALQSEGSLMRGLELWQAKAEPSAHIDYGFHMAILEASDAALAEMEQVVAAGVPSFKVFMAYKGAFMVDDEELFRVLKCARRTGGTVCVHAENGDAIAVYVEEALAEGRVEPRFHASTRPPDVEAEATGRAIRLAAWADAPLFIVHVTCEGAVREVQRARDAGLDVTAETCVQYLLLTVDELARPGFEGAKYVCSPPLRSEHDQEVLWAALARGALEVCSTDHCPFNFADQKELGRGNFSKIPNGMPTIEHRLSLLWDRGVRTGRITPSDLVRLTSTGPARHFGLLPRKGALAPGADADIVVFDPDARTTISASTHHMNVDYNPFEGVDCRGVPRFVLSRGDLVFADGAVRSRSGRGRFVSRASRQAPRPWASASEIAQADRSERVK